jgi:hypothetical protein
LLCDNYRFKLSFFLQKEQLKYFFSKKIVDKPVKKEMADCHPGLVPGRA